MKMFSKSTVLAGVTAALLGFSVSAAAVAPTIDFTGDYAVANWIQSPGDGLIDLTGAPTSVTLTSGNLGHPSVTNFTIAASTASTVSFNWTYSTSDDPTFDPASFLKGVISLPLSNDAGPNFQSGFYSSPVATGQVFGFSVVSLDGQFGPATLTITDFKVSPVPEPGSLAMLTAGLMVVAAARRRKQV